MALYAPGITRPKHHDRLFKIVADGSRNGQGWAKMAQNLNNVIPQLQDRLLQSLDDNIAALKNEDYNKSTLGKLYHYQHVNQGYIYFFFHQEAEQHYHTITELIEAVGAAVYAFSVNNRRFHGIGVGATSVRAWLDIWNVRNHLPYFIDNLYSPEIRVDNKVIDFVLITNRNSYHAIAKLIEVKLREFENRADVQFDFKNNPSGPNARLFRNEIANQIVTNIIAGQIADGGADYIKYPKQAFAKGYKHVQQYENYVDPALLAQQPDDEVKLDLPSDDQQMHENEAGNRFARPRIDAASESTDNLVLNQILTQHELTLRDVTV